MDIRTRREVNVTILDLDGDLTIGAGDVRLRDEVHTELATGVKGLLLNLEAVRHMDSSGLGELLRCKATAARQGVRIKLLHVEKKARKILQMTQLLGVFETFDDESEAIASFREP